MTQLQLAEKYIELDERAVKQKKKFEIPFVQFCKLYKRKTCDLTKVELDDESANICHHRKVILLNPKLGYTPSNIIVVSNFALTFKNQFNGLKGKKSMKSIGNMLNIISTIDKFNKKHKL